MDIQASGKYLRVSPRKLQLLVKGFKELTPIEAVQRLEFVNKSGARELKQVILSALSNAKNQNLSGDVLAFKQLTVQPGGMMKRFRAVSRGMAHTYKKRMSHVKVVLTAVNSKSTTLKMNESRENVKIKDQSAK